MNNESSILLVDDEIEIRSILKEALSAPGRRFIEAANGEEAVLELIKERPDAMIVDFKMPKMDGLHLLKKLRQKNYLVPSIMITGNAAVDPTLSQQALLLGVLQFMEKPIDFKQLTRVTEKAVGMGRKLSGLEAKLETLCVEQDIPIPERTAFKKEKRAQLTAEILMDAMSSEFSTTGK